MIYGVWAIHNGSVEATTKDRIHTSWFNEIGFPSSGQSFDRVTRGGIHVHDDKIRIDVYADAGTPEIAIEYINTILEKIGITDDGRPVSMFLQGDCFSRKMM